MGTRAGRGEDDVTDFYAHSLPGAPFARWETYAQHAVNVAERAAGHAAAFGFAELARLAGLLHDLGKLSPEFQAYLRQERDSGGDHSSAGARLALDTYGESGMLGIALAAVIAGHHAGLADGKALRGRMDGQRLPQNWRAVTGALPAPPALVPSRHFDLKKGPPGFAAAFLIRMLFSCLVDADFIATEHYYAQAAGIPVDRGGHTPLPVLLERLRGHMAGLAAAAPATELNACRAHILRHAVEKAALEPGMFTLTVPTGGGKTLASLSFALEHAARHQLDRVIYVIPYTSIIEQTASVFERALGGKDDILEHHASFDWEGARRTRTADDEAPDALAKLQRAAENWDAPIVVTTAVQFFESLFADKTSRCRKLHNIARSVVILDEVQTLPVHLLRPCMAALEQLACNYAASIVLCTATQPALRQMDGAIRDRQGTPLGFVIDDTRELAPDPKGLYEKLRRVRVERRADTVADGEIASRFADQPQMLCIVNTRAHAQDLFAAIRHLPGVVHLSTLMCARHRRLVLEDLRAKLREGAPVRLVATSLIEAGVDIDFPEVWRAATGADGIAQAAGRANREGRLTDEAGGPRLGRVVVFTPAEHAPQREMKVRWQAAQEPFRRYDDPLVPDAVTLYFQELYWQKGPDDPSAALDAVEMPDEPRGFLATIAERGRSFDFPFAKMALAFRMIEEANAPVIVPWQAHAGDTDAQELLARIAHAEKPRRDDMRRLQQYVVQIPKTARDEWLARGVLVPVRPSLREVLLRFQDLSHYRAETGVDLAQSSYRASESNLV
ncbi:MAG: CRISPR-associated endonuclease Cas3'' [Rhizobiales bacterium]|nr:CRISPR-associated endonuclease Cas3'' [Hyphomicrobiales bacterium]